MKKLLNLLLFSAIASASNYRIVPLSPDALALSGSNLAKMYGPDAAAYNPSQLAFIGSRPQVEASLTLYRIGGSKYESHLNSSLEAINAGDKLAYANASDAEGRDFYFGMGTFAASLPINESNFLGFAVYTDMAAVFGWNTPYAKMLAERFDIRSGTAALSYAIKPIEDLSLAFTLTLNRASMRYSLVKDRAKNPRYFGNEFKCMQDKTCTQNDIIDHIFWHSDNEKDYEITKLNEHFVYQGSFVGDNNWPLGYRLSATYAPRQLDGNLRLSVVYNSAYNTDFSGDLSYEMARWAIYDFITNAIVEYPDAVADFPLDDTQDFVQTVIYPVFGPKYDPLTGELTGDYEKFKNESPEARGKISGRAKSSLDYPASLAFGASYSAGRHDFNFNYSHTFWHKVRNLQISLGFSPRIKDPLNDNSMLNYLLAHMVSNGTNIKWHDTDFFAIGYRYNGDKWSISGGFATEDTPLPRSEMTFMSKDARMYQLSLGAEYRGFERLFVEFAFAHQIYADVSTGYVDDVLVKSRGRFYDQSSQIASVGVRYIF